MLAKQISVSWALHYLLSGAHSLPMEVKNQTLLHARDQDLTLSVSDSIVKEKRLRNAFHSTTPTLTSIRVNTPLDVFAGKLPTDLSA